MSGQVLGLGGAYTALAEGPEGAYVSAASPAIRSPFSIKRFDFEPSFSFSLPGGFSNVDFENKGTQSEQSRFANALQLNLGATVQYGPFGATFLADFMNMGFRNADGSKASTSMLFNRYNALFAWTLLDGQLAIGAGVRGANLSFPSSLVDATSFLAPPAFGPQFGFTLLPHKWPFRVSATYRAPLYVTNIQGNPSETLPDGTQVASGRILPSRISFPWEVELGAALQVGPKPLNPEFVDPAIHERAVRYPIERARAARAETYAKETAKLPLELRGEHRRTLDAIEHDLRRQEEVEIDEQLAKLAAMREARTGNWPRPYVLVSFSLLVTGGTANSVGLQSFIDQKYEPFGASVSLSPRIGFEGEPIPNWLRLRAGTYVEPSRYEDGSPRQHFTFGFDVKLFTFDPIGINGGRPWRVRLAADFAPRYFNYGFAIGSWR